MIKDHDKSSKERFAYEKLWAAIKSMTQKKEMNINSETNDITT